MAARLLKPELPRASTQPLVLTPFEFPHEEIPDFKLNDVYHIGPCLSTKIDVKRGQRLAYDLSGLPAPTAVSTSSLFTARAGWLASKVDGLFIDWQTPALIMGQEPSSPSNTVKRDENVL